MTTMTRTMTNESRKTMMAMNDDEEADNDEAEIFQNVSFKKLKSTTIQTIWKKVCLIFHCKISLKVKAPLLWKGWYFNLLIRSVCMLYQFCKFIKGAAEFKIKNLPFIQRNQSWTRAIVISFQKGVWFLFSQNVCFSSIWHTHNIQYSREVNVCNLFQQSSDFWKNFIFSFDCCVGFCWFGQ